MRPLAALLTFLASLLLLASGASAQDVAVTAGKTQLGARIGYGVIAGDSEPTPYAVGLGGSLGYTTRESQVYLGAEYTYHLGETIELEVGSETVELRANAYDVGAKIGYDLAAGNRSVLRFQSGVGLLSWSAATVLGRGHERYIYLSPGLTIVHYLAEDVSVGATAEYLLVPTASEAGMFRVAGALAIGF